MLSSALTARTGTFTHNCNILKTIAHPERMAILMLLLDNGYSIAELSELTGQNAATLSRHLNKMRLLGIIGHTRFMRIVQYRLISDHVRQVLHTLQNMHHNTSQKN